MMCGECGSQIVCLGREARSKVGMSSTPMMDSTCDTVLTSSFCGRGIAGHFWIDCTEEREEWGDGEGGCVARRCKAVVVLFGRARGWVGLRKEFG